MGKNIITYQKRLNLIDECLRKFDHPMNIKEIQKYCNQRLDRDFRDRTYRYDLEKIEMEYGVSYRVTMINGYQCFTYADESFSINNDAVDITRGEPKDVTMNFGKRITASFWLYITDPYPEEVDEVEIIIDPNQNVDTPNQYAFNPFTGFSFARQSYKTNFYKKNTPNNSFKIGLTISCFLTAKEQVVDVKVNMKDSSGKLIRTRTFNAVTLKQNCTTKATGYFFTNSVSNGYTFDTTDDEELSYAF